MSSSCLFVGNDMNEEFLNVINARTEDSTFDFFKQGHSTQNTSNS